MDNLEKFRRFCYEYPAMISEATPRKSDVFVISNAPRPKLPCEEMLPGSLIRYAPRSESWQPGQLHPNLSWTPYITLLRVDRNDARALYEIEAIQNNR